MTFLMFTPLYGLILAANIAVANNVARILTYIITGLINMLLIGVGALALVAVGLNIGKGMPMLEDMNFGTAGPIFLLTGILGLVLLVPQVRATIISGLRLSLEPDNTIHMVALNIAVWAIGSSLGSVLLTSSVPTETLQGMMESVTLLSMWEQAAAFVLIALLGVGFGLRRGWTETRERLGLGGLTWVQIALLPAITIGLVLLQSGISLLWASLDPEGFERISQINGTLLQDAITPLGVITIGLTAGIGEELLLRGAVQPRFGIILTTLVFTILHSQYEISFATLIVILLSIAFGFLRRYMNTTACIIVHTGYNSILVLMSLLAQSFSTAP